jgi:hypothetical protein
MAKGIIYFFKDFTTNSYGIAIESDVNSFSMLLPISYEKKVMGGVLNRNKVESLRDFLNLLLKE